MKTCSLGAIVAAALVALAGCATGGATDKAYTCSAEGLVSGSYTAGDSRAYIHLSGFSHGNQYAVKETAPGVVSGTTGNGTPFTCSASP